MRDVLASFIEASAARGAWESALAAWNTALFTNSREVSSNHTLLLTRVLAQYSRWREAVAVATSAETALCSRQLAARRVALLATIKAGSWREACQQVLSVRRYLENSAAIGPSVGYTEEAEISKELYLVVELIEQDLLQGIPTEQRGLWDPVVGCLRGKVERHPPKQAGELRRCIPDVENTTRSDEYQMRCGSDADHVTNNEELVHILRKPKERNSWCGALRLLSDMQHPNAASVNIVITILKSQGREAEVLRVVNDFMVSRKIQPTAITVKAVSEAANTMRSLPLCISILGNPSMRGKLTAQSAVPMVLALQRLAEWKRCLEWWSSVPPPTTLSDEGTTDYNSGGVPNLRRHLKLSSYVAVCLAGGGCWLDALAALHYAAPYDPPLAILFSLRALRVAGNWEAAVTLLHKNCSVWKGSKVTLQVLDVVTEQNAESWIPPHVVHVLRGLFRS
ncbi:hypothetical protein, conserved [Trypanosoma brucei gambiense DAL972]|uniref:Uncharacterized protein n=2 Tax=Trypanosoma brucei TaxID=5691 RepID=D0A524_TRYB9|nr:hypothetical protein, conserved [Trypanosoma brucei gambiense DAL972]RHW68876.1 hypothetical protein DPX39_100127800 [Trypanosoma brucei equiperdum]CBH16368.1 hypothetical protein, conserved [Trypanosoma brucei gambiense DAL972]|eukprot:XP_011778632.1 hypothetical protein, conserved [Trypanosoma brucei gambiense DAL972]